jgi:hypothetical protein
MVPVGRLADEPRAHLHKTGNVGVGREPYQLASLEPIFSDGRNVIVGATA